MNIRKFIKEFNWGPGSFLVGYHLLLLVALPWYFLHYTLTWKLALISSVLMYVTGLSVTAGYHRLYSHTTYKINPVVEAILLLFSTMATQGSAIRWSFDHRHHHAFVDTDRDPYSIKKGFWYAHFLWLFEKPKPIENSVVSDLIRKPLLRFQHRFYGLLMLLTNVAAFLVVGWCLNDYLGAFLFAWVARTFVLHHFTWFINSLAHTWGSRPFCQELSAVDNYMISLLTFGEGYHNYHHKFAYDYRNGIRWYHFDPTKWLIWVLNKCKLAHQLKRVHPFLIEKKLLLDRKALLLEKIQTSLHAQKEEWEQKVTTVIDNVLAKLEAVKDLREEYSTLKKNKEEKKDTLYNLKLQLKDVKKSLNREYRLWISLARYVDKLPDVS